MKSFQAITIYLIVFGCGALVGHLGELQHFWQQSVKPQADLFLLVLGALHFVAYVLANWDKLAERIKIMLWQK